MHNHIPAASASRSAAPPPAATPVAHVGQWNPELDLLPVPAELTLSESAVAAAAMDEMPLVAATPPIVEGRWDEAQEAVCW